MRVPTASNAPSRLASRQGGAPRARVGDLGASATALDAPEVAPVKITRPALRSAPRLHGLARRACRGGAATHRCNGRRTTRSVPVRAVDARRLRRLLEAARHLHAAGFYDRFAECRSCSMAAGTTLCADRVPRTIVGLGRATAGGRCALMGPWTHGSIVRCRTPATWISGRRRRSTAWPSYDWRQLRLRWFDRWLRGIDNGVDARPAVRIFVMGGGSGRRTADGPARCTAGAGATRRDWPLARHALHALSTCTATARSAWNSHPRNARRSPIASTRPTPCRPSAAMSRRCGTSCRCPTGSRTRAMPAVDSAPPTSWPRADSTSGRGRRFTAAARPICRWALAPTSSSSRPSPCRSPPRSPAPSRSCSGWRHHPWTPTSRPS